MWLDGPYSLHVPDARIASCSIQIKRSETPKSPYLQPLRNAARQLEHLQQPKGVVLPAGEPVARARVEVEGHFRRSFVGQLDARLYEVGLPFGACRDNAELVAGYLADFGGFSVGFRLARRVRRELRGKGASRGSWGPRR